MSSSTENAAKAEVYMQFIDNLKNEHQKLNSSQKYLSDMISYKDEVSVVRNQLKNIENENKFVNIQLNLANEKHDNLEQEFFTMAGEFNELKADMETVFRILKIYKTTETTMELG